MEEKEKIKGRNGGTLTPWKKGYGGGPGRPKKVVSRVIDGLKEEGFEGVKRVQVVEVFELLLGLPEAKVKEIVKDENQPVLLRLVGKELLGKRSFEVVKDLLDRAHGRPKQAVDVTSGGYKVGEFKGFSFLEPLAAKPGPASDGGEREGNE